MEYILAHLPKIVNSIGLLFDIVGAILIWKYGLPDSISKSGSEIVTHSVDPESEKKKAKKYEFWGKTGLGLLMFGFLLQLISNFLS